MTQYFIYKLVCDDCDFIYVGSTRSIKDRKRQHKSRSKTSEMKVYRMIRENGGWENWRMVILEECDETIETKRQAEMREETFRLELKADLNSKRAYRSEDDIKADKKEHNKEYNSTPERKAYNKEYRSTPQRKAYNKEYMKEYIKEYQQRPEVKERRNAQARERRRLKKEAQDEYTPSSPTFTSSSSSCTSLCSFHKI